MICYVSVKETMKNTPRRSLEVSAFVIKQKSDRLRLNHG